jgi:hypothetical protein
MDILSSQVTAAAVVSFLIAFLKKQSWFPWLTTETDKLNRVVAIVLSGLASVGIHASFNHAAGQLVITGLTLTSVAQGLWHWGTQFALTHGWFKATSASDQLYGLLKQLIAAQQQRPPVPVPLVPVAPAAPVTPIQ